MAKYFIYNKLLYLVIKSIRNQWVDISQKIILWRPLKMKSKVLMRRMSRIICLTFSRIQVTKIKITLRSGLRAIIPRSEILTKDQEPRSIAWIAQATWVWIRMKAENHWMTYSKVTKTVLCKEVDQNHNQGLQSKRPFTRMLSLKEMSLIFKNCMQWQPKSHNRRINTKISQWPINNWAIFTERISVWIDWKRA